eukprot:SAG11_NODE_675_length_7800_cov_6.380730_5_plen_299_part_00
MVCARPRAKTCCEAASKEQQGVGETSKTCCEAASKEQQGVGETSKTCCEAASKDQQGVGETSKTCCEAASKEQQGVGESVQKLSVELQARTSILMSSPRSEHRTEASDKQIWASNLGLITVGEIVTDLGKEVRELRSIVTIRCYENYDVVRPRIHIHSALTANSSLQNLVLVAIEGLPSLHIIFQDEMDGRGIRQRLSKSRAMDKTRQVLGCTLIGSYKASAHSARKPPAHRSLATATFRACSYPAAAAAAVRTRRHTAVIGGAMVRALPRPSAVCVHLRPQDCTTSTIPTYRKIDSA